MLRKKQVVAIVSIALTCFLIGTSMASDGGSPWNRVWEAISGLQNRVSVIEEEANQVKTIRFHEPQERMTDQSQYVDVATFVWTPSNNTNNAILRINCYFKYRTEAGNKMLFRIAVNDESCGIMGWLESPTYKQSVVYSHSLLTDIGLRVSPNQSNYTLKFQLTSFYSGAKVYAKEISIVLEVVDGLPASN